MIIHSCVGSAFLLIGNAAHGIALDQERLHFGLRSACVRVTWARDGSLRSIGTFGSLENLQPIRAAKRWSSPVSSRNVPLLSGSSGRAELGRERAASESDSEPEGLQVKRSSSPMPCQPGKKSLRSTTPACTTRVPSKIHYATLSTKPRSLP